MRFSLGTLVLVTLWIGAMIAVVMWRQPWQESSVIESSNIDIQPVLRSPDGTRECGPTIQSEWALFDAKTNALLTQLPCRYGAPIKWRAKFVDNDTLNFQSAEFLSSPDKLGEMISWTIIYRRRFPEWWWGHFYRPEVWCALVLTAVLAWRFAAPRKNLRGSWNVHW